MIWNKFYLLCLINLILSTVILSSTAKSKGFSSSSSSSVVNNSVSMVVNGKSYVNSQHSELYRDKRGQGPEEVRAYRDFFEKNDNDPGLFIRDADTNVDNEKLILGDQPDVSWVNGLVGNILDNVKVSFFF